MRSTVCEIAGLTTFVVAPEASPQLDVILLHGYAMGPQDLEPFAHSLGLAARFLLPTAPLKASPGGYSWWRIDEEQRQSELSLGPRDLASMAPLDRDLARQRFLAFCSDSRKSAPSRPLVICGFSQGGMVACDAILCGGLTVNGLALLSSSRIAITEWQQHRDRVNRLPVLVSHGRGDRDLAFSAGEALRDFHVGSGASVTWVPFEGTHEIPLLVWRRLRSFLKTIVAQNSANP
jgi:phospholipase/carboxylesterase